MAVFVQSACAHIKELQLDRHSSRHSRASRSHTPNFYFSLTPSSSPDLHRQFDMVNDANRRRSPTKRPSVKLKISCGGSNISNSEVISASGQSLYSISSNSKSTTLVSCNNNIEVATVNWDRSSPRMVFRREKMKCKEWLPLAGPDTEYAPSLRY